MKLGDFTTLTFDCYGTLIDWKTGIDAALGAWAARSGWRAGRDAVLDAFDRHERRVQAEAPGLLYPAVLAETLKRMGGELDAEVTGEDAVAFGASIKDWPAFPDSADALAYLKRHYRLVVLSNVDRQSFAHSNARLGVEFDAVYTAQDIGTYKPDLNNFRYMLDKLAALGVAPGEILHTAQSLFHDHGPAKELGLASCWIDRPGSAERASATPPAAARPDFRFASLAALVAAHRAERGS